MSTPTPRNDIDEEETYQFACPDCWAVRIVTLTPGAKRPMCDCGSPLSVIGERTAPHHECFIRISASHSGWSIITSWCEFSAM